MAYEKARPRSSAKSHDLMVVTEHGEHTGARPGHVLMPGRRFAARARMLSDAEKATVWADIRRAIPQIGVYEKRTNRNIRVSRL